MAIKKFKVIHPSLNLAVGGKLQRVELGSLVEMEEKHAEKLVASGKLEVATPKKATKVDSDS